MIRLIVGLGNPGPEYEHTRHNAGFWWVDAAARQLGESLSFDRNYHGLLARLALPDGPVWLLQPMTFMNLSGKSVGPLARFFKIEPAQILVVHDELDLAPGQIKLKQGGGAAGHNGLKDILAQLGSPDFWRLRIGIGHPGDRAEVSNWVLKRPPLEDRLTINQCIAASVETLPLLLAGAMDRAMMKIHAKPPRPKPPPPPRPLAGLTTAPLAGLSTAPLAGLSTVPLAGLSTVPLTGLSKAPPAGQSTGSPADGLAVPLAELPTPAQE